MTLTVVDLFAGAGGLSTGVAKACEDLDIQPGEDLELHAVNHWEPAIQTHEANHPWAEHYHARIEELYPPDVVDPGSVTLLTGGPECTHFSSARGGKPVSDQKRASAWHVLDWIEKLHPEHVLLENVTEFRKWGPIEDDGTPSKDGTIFERWIGMLEALGYSVVFDEEDDDFGVVLNAADYGDPQSRSSSTPIPGPSRMGARSRRASAASASGRSRWMARRPWNASGHRSAETARTNLSCSRRSVRTNCARGHTVARATSSTAGTSSNWSGARRTRTRRQNGSSTMTGRTRRGPGGGTSHRRRAGHQVRPHH